MDLNASRISIHFFSSASASLISWETESFQFFARRALGFRAVELCRVCSVSAFMPTFTDKLILLHPLITSAL